MMKRRAGVLFTLALLAAATDSFAAQTSVVAHTASPVLGPSTTLRKFRSPFISDAAGKRIVFRGAVYDPVNPESLHAIIRLDATGSGDVVAARGQSTNDGTTFRNFLQPAINDNSDVAWFAFLANGERGIYRTTGGSPANLRTVAVRNQNSPIVGYVFDDFDAPEITAGGAVVFWARIVSGSSSIEGLFSCSGGNGSCAGGGTGTMSVLAKSGDLISGGGGLRVCTFVRTLRVSSWGMAFLGQVKSDCTFPGGTETVLRKDFANTIGLKAIATVGTSTGSTGSYARFRDSPTIEDNGIVAYRADTTDVSSNEAIFRCDPGAGCPSTSSPQRIVSKGEVGGGLELRRLSSAQVINSGDVAFLSRPRGTGVSGPTIYIWNHTTTILQLVATGNQLVNDPNLPADTTFRRIGSLAASGGGDIVFRGTVSGSGLTWSTGIFLWQP